MVSSTALYNVPLSQLNAYRGRPLIVRASDPATLAKALSSWDSDQIACIQLLGLPPQIDPLLHILVGVPVDIVLDDPKQYPALYGLGRLLDHHPVRLTLPVAKGVNRAVRLAGALEYAVKLDPGQPAAPLIEQMGRVLDYYLHHATVSQPIDFFHGLLLAICHGKPATLWQIQEEDPAQFRQLDEQGQETGAGRLAGRIAAPVETFVAEHAERQRRGNECADCPFFAHCQGYFKWPDPGYRCDGIKALLQKINHAATELAHDLAASPRADGASE